jgi:hypothetical protein
VWRTCRSENQKRRDAAIIRKEKFLCVIFSFSLVLLTMSLFAVVTLAQPLGAARVYSCAGLKQAPIPNTTITLAQARPASTNPPAHMHYEIVGKNNERVGQVELIELLKFRSEALG